MWVELTPETLLGALSAREKATLDRAATDPSQESALGEIALTVAAEWRGGLRRVTLLDRRPRHVPTELLAHILADYRYRAFTRLPGMSGLLDSLRVEEWRRANTVRDNLGKVSVEEPEAEYAESSEQSGQPSPVINVPESILE